MSVPRRCAGHLPVELGANLPNARIACVGHDSEVRAGDVAARIQKLRMVEYIEKFDTNVKGKIRFQLRPLQQPKIGVVESRAVKESPVGVAKSAEHAVLDEGPRGRHTRVWIGD